MKKYILFILLLYSVCVQSQSSPDTLNIQYAEELINLNSQLFALPSTYMVFISDYYSMFTFEEDNYYKTFYYYKPAYYEKIRLIGFEKEKINKKSMFYYIFNNRYDCVTEFIPDTLLIRNIYPNRYHNSFHYFALYRHRDVDCEFNFPKLKLKENIILHNKKYVDYLLGKLVSGAIMPSLPVPSRL